MNNTTSHRQDCLFCQIIAGDIPAEKIYEDEDAVAFLDINPVNHGHVLIIPKDHSRNIFDISPETLCNTVPALLTVARAVKEGLSADGANIHINNEPDAGQVIFHTHIHIIPRFKGDGIQMWPQAPYPEGKARQVAEKIIAALPV